MFSDEQTLIVRQRRSQVLYERQNGRQNRRKEHVLPTMLQDTAEEVMGRSSGRFRVIIDVALAAQPPWLGWKTGFGPEF